LSEPSEVRVLLALNQPTGERFVDVGFKLLKRPDRDLEVTEKLSVCSTESLCDVCGSGASSFH
jgi:hypothetical protein